METIKRWRVGDCDRLEKERDTLRAQLDEMTERVRLSEDNRHEALNRAHGKLQAMEVRLVEAQAREAAMREALMAVGKPRQVLLLLGRKFFFVKLSCLYFLKHIRLELLFKTFIRKLFN